MPRALNPEPRTTSHEMPLFHRITIVGLGLIGGSLGLAVKRRRLAQRVVGVSRHPSTLRRAKRRGAIDVGTTDLARAAQGADLVVLATPVDQIVPLAQRAASAMRAGTIITDVGSTKAALVRALERSLLPGVAFVGAHPIAGSEAQGIEAASARLFDGAVCVLTQTPRTDRAALARVARLWKGLAGRIVTMSPRQHDRVLAGCSHLPHLVAWALVRAVSVAPLARAPQSFLDMTRIAKSDPELWDDIFLTNRTELLAAMTRFERHWRALRAALVRPDRRALRGFLAGAKAKRDALD